jgi:hypothetical protein
MLTSTEENTMTSFTRFMKRFVEVVLPPTKQPRPEESKPQDLPVIEVILETEKVVEELESLPSDDDTIFFDGLVSKLNTMTKAEIADYAKAEPYDVSLDRRRTKQAMIEDFIQKLKEKN